jgi:nucleoside-diphosphate-sugar epimerase
MEKITLVTGSSGKLGTAVVSELLGRGLAVRGFDRKSSDLLPETVTGDITDRATLDQAMIGVDTLIHLAATPDDDDFIGSLLPNNIASLYHVMEAARCAGVRRIVLASSSQVNWWQRLSGPFPIKESQPPAPKAWYAATKMFMESIGYSYSQMHGISVIVARIGWCPRPGQEREIHETEWAQDIYLSPRDAGRFFACCISAPETLRHLTVNVTSIPKRLQRIDLSVARDVLNFAPQDTYPQGMEPGL